MSFCLFVLVAVQLPSKQFLVTLVPVLFVLFVFCFLVFAISIGFLFLLCEFCCEPLKKTISQKRLYLCSSFLLSLSFFVGVFLGANKLETCV